VPKKARELGPLDIKRMTQGSGTKTEVFSVGGVTGLYLQVTPSGAASWLLRIKVGTLRREIGLGAYPDVTLAQAREKARTAREEVRLGRDPVAERQAAKTALKAAQSAAVTAKLRAMTFDVAMTHYLKTKLEGYQNTKHRAQWRSTLETYAKPALGAMLVADIQVQDVLRALEPIWMEKPETASRVRGRIEAVLAWATVAGHRTGDNPARWAGNLKELLPALPKANRVENQPALALDETARWFAALRKREGMGARALEFLAMVALRSGEVRGAEWSEFDLERGLWVIPAQRMKMKREHRVPLPEAALALLRALPRQEGNNLVFWAVRGGMLSDMTLSATMRRMHESDIEAGGPGFIDRASKRPAVPHGLRSTFRDWVAERTRYPGDMAEVALAHRISSAVEAAYRRGDMIDKRRAMMADWAAFMAGQSAPDNVVRIG
jgi:integrase